VTAVVVCPGLHLSRHAALAAHTHAGAAVEVSGTVADLVALGLEDAGSPAVVDCSLAALTLVDCDTPSHGTRRFGDRPAEPDAPRIPPLDPRHGAGSAEHLGASLLAAQTFVLPPPPVVETRLGVFARPLVRSLFATRTHDSRGPPSPRPLSIDL
jgi:hypothetical protein